ncbi:MAG TPA: ABC transporter substrate-binding protein, partial [Dehalococcoidales bacterium]|nr:ABC transporter substrate-binding protein [Dehalococcoidales bacterium]
PAATTPVQTTPKPTTPTTVTPKRGGTLRVIQVNGPTNLSYVPEQNMTDETSAKAYAETLVYWAGNGEFLPELATSWDLDQANKTVTFKLRQGVKFHDGTPFNAEAVRANVQLLIDNKRLSNGQFVTAIEAVDEYTFRYKLNGWMSPQLLLHSYGYNLLTMYSPTALQKNGKDWCKSNFVTTGPFIFESYTRDVGMKIVRNNSYWRGSQYPYMDAIQWIYVADNTIAATKLQAGEGDAWTGPPLKETNDLLKMGFVNNPLPNMYQDIVLDNKTAGPFKDIRVREAVEYAIDREGLAAAFGYGMLKPVFQVGPVGTAGHNPNFKERRYNVAKAKELLAAAGFSGGFSTTLLTMSGGRDVAAALQAMLAEVGIKVTVDVADVGRYMGALYGPGWGGGILLFSVPIDPVFCIGWFVHFGPRAIFPYPSLEWPAQYKTLTEAVYNAPDAAGLAKATQDMITFVNEQAVVIPLIQSLTSYVTTKAVKTDRYKDHFMVWHTYKDWLDK